MPSEEPVWIVTYDGLDAIAPSGEKGWGQEITRRISSGLASNPVSPEKIKTEWTRVMNLIGELIQNAEEQAGGQFDMKLDEVTLSVEINSKGQVAILGTCIGEASGKGAITLKFKRPEVK